MKNWILFFSTVVVVFFLGWLSSEIMSRKAEAKFAYQPQTKIVDVEPRDSVWGVNYPRQYQSYRKTADTTFKSYYYSAGHRDILADHPETVVLFAGYGFSKEYNQAKGHDHAVRDIRDILRTGAPMNDGDGPMPATCWTCKSTDVPRLMKELGTAEFYNKKWSHFGSEVVNPIGCADCHDPKSMSLRITRPALVEAFERIGRDITQVSHQEMRTLVCAQCHVEYYFKKGKPGEKDANYLVFPWDEGMDAFSVEDYYNKMGFADWQHPISKTPMIKAQHPDYELFQRGIHAQRGVSCADCHMPYKSEGGQKFTDHHIQSPLANVENSCFVCHREKTDDLVRDVFVRQSTIKEGTKALEKLLVRAHVEAGKALELGASEKQIKQIQQHIRNAQWRWDYSVASHGAAFHAPLETSRIVTSATEEAQQARIMLARLLADLGYSGEVPYPDISTKAKAQKYIGLDIQKDIDAKEKFLKKVVPQWDKNAKQRESQMNVTASASK